MKGFLVVAIALFAIMFFVGFMNRSQMAGVVSAGLEHAGLKPMPKPEEEAS